MRRLIPLGLLLAIIAVYANALHGPFIWDDNDAIVQNWHIRSLSPLSEAISSRGTPILGGRPLIVLSLAFNYSLGQLNPMGYHLFNIVTHMACTLLMFELIRRTLLLPRWGGRYDQSACWFSGAAALLWSLHPINTEAVDYVTQRTETLMSMFLLLTLYAIVRGARSGRPALWNLLAVASCAAGMACKQTMVVAPVLAMIFDLIFLPRRLPGRRFLHSGLMATWLILLLVLRGQDLQSMNPVGPRTVTPCVYLETQAGVILHYLRLCFWPRGLTIDYSDWPLAPNFLAAIIPGLLLMSFLGVTLVCCAFRAWPGFVGACFFLILAPTSSLLPLPREIVAERRMYLPSAAVVILAVAAAWQMLRWLIPQSAPKAIAIALALIAVIFGTTTAARNRTFQSSISLWADAVDKRPKSPLAHYFLAQAHAELGDWAEARAQAQIAYQLVHSPTIQALLDDINRHDPNAQQLK